MRTLTKFTLIGLAMVVVMLITTSKAAVEADCTVLAIALYGPTSNVSGKCVPIQDCPNQVIANILYVSEGLVDPYQQYLCTDDTAVTTLAVCCLDFSAVTEPLPCFDAGLLGSGCRANTESCFAEGGYDVATDPSVPVDFLCEEPSPTCCVYNAASGCSGLAGFYSGTSLQDSTNVYPLPAATGLDPDMAQDLYVRLEIVETAPGSGEYGRRITVKWGDADQIDLSGSYSVRVRYNADSEGPVCTGFDEISFNIDPQSYLTDDIYVSPVFTNPPVAACTELSTAVSVVYTSPNSPGRTFSVIDDPFNPTDLCIDLQTCCDVVTPPPPPGCVQGYGSWRKESDRAICLEQVDVCGLSADELMLSAPKGDMFYILGRQFGTAFYNDECGCANPSPEDIAIMDQAKEMLMQNCPSDGSAGIGTDHPNRGQAAMLSDALELLNGGNASVPSCVCDETDIRGSQNGTPDIHNPEFFAATLERFESAEQRQQSHQGTSVVPLWLVVLVVIAVTLIGAIALYVVMANRGRKHQK